MNRRRTPLTSAEKETIIRFDQTPAPASVFTYSKAWQKQIEEKLGIKPIMTNRYGGREYLLPKSSIRRPQAPRKLSPQARRQLQARGRALHKQLPSKNTGESNPAADEQRQMEL